MRRGIAAATALLFLLAGCGGGDGDGEEPAAAASASPSVDPDAYGDTIVEAFRDTYPDPGTSRYAGDRGEPSDWAAFVEVIRDLQPPEDLQLEHEQMVAGFDAYVEAEENAEAVCLETPGPGGPCYVAVSDSSDQWTAALDRAYELPGLSWEALLG